MSLGLLGGINHSVNEDPINGGRGNKCQLGVEQEEHLMTKRPGLWPYSPDTRQENRMALNIYQQVLGLENAIVFPAECLVEVGYRSQVKSALWSGNKQLGASQDMSIILAGRCQ